jgi:hypothetical protein
MRPTRRMADILLLVAFVCAAAGTALSGDKDAGTEDLQETIDYIIEFVRASDVVFIRNDQEHTPQEAAEHMLRKYKYARGKVKAPEDFIEYCATKSTVSGKPYRVRLRDGTTITSAEWLLGALEKYRSFGGEWAVAGGLPYEMREFCKQYGDCSTRNEDCVSVVIHYPEFGPGTASAALVAIDSEIKRHLLAPVYEDTEPGSYDELADSFIDAYMKVQEDFPDYKLGWTLDRAASVTYARSAVLCIAFTEVSFTGGAHPNSRKTYVNFDVSKGRESGLSDILVEGYEAELTRVAEEKFREVRGIGEDESLEEAGFWFEGGIFGLNDNFGISADGLVFYFNDYEIGPHAMGPTELTIPYERISTLIREDGILKGVAK